MLYGLSAFFTCTWWWLNCRMAKLLNLLYFILYISSGSVNLSLHSPFLQRKCPVSKFPVLCHVLLMPPHIQLVQFQLHYRPPKTQNIFFLSESSFWFISQTSNSKSIWTVKHSLGFEAVVSYKNWNFLKFRDCLMCGLSQRYSLNKTT